ncbi:unnamed protein product [Ectocarpus sp. CCAP 1310/34]|nr:unnamed protein product [Ectocarpus sp. CCAP 1310/34]
MSKQKLVGERGEEGSTGCDSPKE